MQPLEENTFEQIPWFATTQTGSIDLYASAVSRNHSNNLNNSNDSKSNKSKDKSIARKNSLSNKNLEKIEKHENGNESIKSSLASSDRKNKTLSQSIRNGTAWKTTVLAANDETPNHKDIVSGSNSLRSKRSSLTKSITNSKLSLRKLLNNNETTAADHKTYIEPLAPIMSYSSQNQIEPNTNMVRFLSYISIKLKSLSSNILSFLFLMFVIINGIHFSEKTRTGRQPLCNKEDNRTRDAGCCSSHSKCIPAQICASTGKLASIL